MRALWQTSLFPGCLSKQYSADTSHSSSIYLEPEIFNVCLILNFIRQKCSPPPTKIQQSQSYSSSMFILGQVVIKWLLNRNASRASVHTKEFVLKSWVG